MRFVPVKNAGQQAVLSLHRVGKPAPGPLAKYGIVMPRGIDNMVLLR